ncbi:peptidase family C26 protein [Schizosaccharomyces cryophilus OY26]|uniref:Peptidase family C26 protein n=1 Tax=Schizosaccharomyces cryophilus (strain OY26 / ATCC MYA-4695 / CBS 11777 / NBRC 106824 / NRRL Y48691) TaxID=653667 RepID=S9VXP1_SCHCR|nr:peptidase family C26 protein [Schizosaccharomyces cryophilus OY26]EPY52328.1 peptidase family C26 protein [Schizosaccharomyces cryophilus OY26]
MIRPTIILSVGYANHLPLYVEAIVKAGGTPIVIYPGLPKSKIPTQVDGVILAGGESVHPSRYGEEYKPNVPISMDLVRDDLEWAIVDFAMKRHLPILGICRGCQLLNVYFGGSLHQQVSHAGYNDVHRPEKGKDYLAHKVVAHSGHLLSILGPKPVFVNSIHDQGIHTVGMGLKPTVFAEDGLCEGLESVDGNVLGIQWHPEAILEKQPHAPSVFRYVVEVAKSKMIQKSTISNVLPLCSPAVPQPSAIRTGP